MRDLENKRPSSIELLSSLPLLSFALDRTTVLALKDDHSPRSHFWFTHVCPAVKMSTTTNPTPIAGAPSQHQIPTERLPEHDQVEAVCFPPNSVATTP